MVVVVSATQGNQHLLRLHGARGGGEVVKVREGAKLLQGWLALRIVPGEVHCPIPGMSPVLGPSMEVDPQGHGARPLSVGGDHEGGAGICGRGLQEALPVGAGPPLPDLALRG